MKHEDLIHRFTYHKPNPQMTDRFVNIRELALQLAEEIDSDHEVETREKSLAITKLEEAVMWANAHIARNT